MIACNVAPSVGLGGGLERATRMFNRFQHRIIRLLVIGWLAVMVASVVMWAIAWGRLSRGIDASANLEPPGLRSVSGEATRRDLTAVYRMTLLAGFLGVGTGL